MGAVTSVAGPILQRVYLPAEQVVDLRCYGMVELLVVTAYMNNPGLTARRRKRTIY